MELNNRSNVNIGDWVKGKSKDGELFFGYIDTVDPSQNIVKVKITECDNEAIIGKALRIPKGKIEKLEVTTVNMETQLRNLIDIALLTNDKDWFLMLTEKLKKVKRDPTVANKTTAKRNELKLQERN